jgi:hypothetical protein
MSVPGARVLDPDADREVVLVGAGIAAASGFVLFASLFVGWYSRAGFCEFTACFGAYEPGYYVCLGGAAVSAVVGPRTAVADGPPIG